MVHVLVTNDDGPPGPESPYLQYFVDALKTYTDWQVSVVLPHQQRSWIGKAHLMGHNITASYIYPTGNGQYEGPLDAPDGSGREPWVLLDGTPASCANIGVAHLFKEKGPVDLVLSGPNYGRNCTALYIMSSGTVGAAMEAALCGQKSIGLSFSFKKKGVHEPAHITEASKIGAKMVQKLYQEWSDKVQLYTINIPLSDSLKEGSTEMHYAPILENQWGASYQSAQEEDGKTKFKWAPDFAACQRSIEQSEPGNDGWVVANDMISVTPLRASFKEVPGFSGQLKLSSNRKQEDGECVIQLCESNYLFPVWRDALAKRDLDIRLDYEPGDTATRTFHYADYDDLDFDRLAGYDPQYLGCSYVYRKALIRKHYLTNTVQFYSAKHPDSALRTAYPESYNLEVDYAEFLDDALDEAYELRGRIEQGDGDKTWILKPSMSDRGQGIRLFSTLEQLQGIFDEFDQGADDVNDDDGDDDQDATTGVVTSQMRHFVVQRYQPYPLLLPAHGNRKFHIRTYVVTVGAIQVYVYREMLALFASRAYEVPQVHNLTVAARLHSHLTNTCIQGAKQDAGSVQLFWQLQGLDMVHKQAVFDQIAHVTGELFKAAACVDRINFQPLNNAFEIYGVDFLVLQDHSVKLLEVNAYPDFKQTGSELKSLIHGLFQDVVDIAVVPFITDTEPKSKNLVNVLDYNVNSW